MAAGADVAPRFSFRALCRRLSRRATIYPKPEKRKDVRASICRFAETRCPNRRGDVSFFGGMVMVAGVKSPSRSSREESRRWRASEKIEGASVGAPGGREEESAVFGEEERWNVAWTRSRS